MVGMALHTSNDGWTGAISDIYVHKIAYNLLFEETRSYFDDDN